MKRTTTAITIVVLLALTGGLPAAAQTETTPPAAPAWTAEETVCPWENVNDDPRLARLCLQAAGVNTGLAAYAFAEEPFDYDPDEPTLSGTPEEAGLVSRWAMGVALHRLITVAVESAGGETPGLPANHQTFFTDVGWLGDDTRRKLELLFDWGITTGTDVYGEYSPTRTVTRAQMGRFFVRSLAAIDRFTGGEGTPGFGADDTWQTLGRQTDAYAIPAPFADVQAGNPPAGILDRGLLGAVSILYDLGVTQGTSFNQDGNPVYRPELNVTGGQMARFLVRLLAHTNVRVTDPQPDLTAADLPEIQQDRLVELDGTRIPEGVHTPGWGELIEPDASTRPPREIDFYYYHGDTHPDYRSIWERAGIYDGGQLLAVSRPLSLQIGDWAWNGPAGEEDNSRVVVVEFRTSGRYIAASSEGTDLSRDPYPLIRVRGCHIPESDPADTSHTTFYAVRVGPGVFRLTNISADGRLLPDGQCNPADYGVPEPAGGYTANFPCEGTSEYVTRLFGEALRPCGT